MKPKNLLTNASITIIVHVLRGATFRNTNVALEMVVIASVMIVRT